MSLKDAVKRNPVLQPSNSQKYMSNAQGVSKLMNKVLVSPGHLKPLLGDESNNHRITSPIH